MRCVYTFWFRSPVQAAPPAPFQHNGLAFAFTVNGPLLTSLQVTVPFPEGHPLPFLEPPTPEKPAHFQIERPLHSEVVSIVRTLLGLLAFTAPVEVNTQEPDVAWLPDSDVEAGALSVYGVRRESGVPSYRKLATRMLVRCSVGAAAARPFEVPLTFYRRGCCALDRGDTIQAYYNFFFVLEHLYGEGKSNPRHLLAAFLSHDLLVTEVAKYIADNTSLLTSARTTWAATPDSVLSRLIVNARRTSCGGRSTGGEPVRRSWKAPTG